MTETVEALISRNLLGVFGEPDEAKRRATIAAIWTEDGVFVDVHGRHVGREALNDAVSQLQAKFPDFVFTAIGSPQTFHGVGRQAWGYGPAGAAPKVTGVDVVSTRAGRIEALYAFLDAPTG